MTIHKKIVVIGGGTGSFTLLSGLKHHTKQLTSIVTMADDGGSTGVLRDELGVLPPGDVRQCLVALSDSPHLRELFTYRFEEGTFKGHAFGNIFLTALEKMTGNFADAIETASEILRVEGKVLPATLDNVRLKMSWNDVSVTLHGERVIDEDYFNHDPRKAQLSLVPEATANPAALDAIREADLVVISPGDLYTSLGPLLVIQGFGDALAQTNAKVVYVTNLVTKRGQTEGFTVSDHAAEIERFAGQLILDVVLYNNQEPEHNLAERYHQESAYLVQIDADTLAAQRYEAIGGDFLGPMREPEAADALAALRTFIRHDSEKLAEMLVSL